MKENNQEYEVIKLLGHGKGGYSYLVKDENESFYVLKQIHHEPCSYYTFGNKIESEINDYKTLSNIGIRMPRLIDVDIENDYEPVRECSIEAKVKSVYNQNGIACFEVSEISTYDYEHYTYRGYFYTVDLSTMKMVNVTDIFAEEEMTHISDLLKMQLKIDAGAKTEDELVELGFYNIDNVRANNNFRIDNNGITWQYLPGELSVVEQIEITLDYDLLNDYMLENTIVSQLIY